jgi:hypothetical protein
MFASYTTVKSLNDMPNAVFQNFLHRKAMKDYAFFVFRESDETDEKYDWLFSGKYPLGFLYDFDEDNQKFFWIYQDSGRSAQIPVKIGDCWCAVPMYVYE